MTAAAAAKVRGGSRLTREEWIEAAIRVIALDGVEALRLDLLAARLNVTKGSFYWHFTDREALLQAVLQTWRQRMTDDTVAYLALKAGTPLGRLRRIIRLAISARPDVPGGPLESALRDWGRRVPAVDAVVREVDASRIGVLRQLYVDIGLSDAEAEAWAFTHMAFIVGGRQILFDDSPQEVERRWHLAEKFLIPPT